ALVRRRGQLGASAECLHRVADPLIVGRDDHDAHRTRGGRPPIHVLDHRTAADVRQRFAWETGRLVSGGNDRDDRDRTGVDRGPGSGNRGHGKSYHDGSAVSVVPWPGMSAPRAAAWIIGAAMCGAWLASAAGITRQARTARPAPRPAEV